MILSTAQVQRFWREWAATCKAMSWTRAAGMSAAEIDGKRKEFLERCGFHSLTEVDRTDGFTKVLAELQVLQGNNLQAGLEANDASLNRARVFRNQILTELVPCLELYIADVQGYLTGIIEDKSRYRKTDRPTKAMTLMDLNAGQLKQVQYTLSARLNAKRKEADETIHAMKRRAGVNCACAICVPRRPVVVKLAEPAPF